MKKLFLALLLTLGLISVPAMAKKVECKYGCHFKKVATGYKKVKVCNSKPKKKAVAKKIAQPTQISAFALKAGDNRQVVSAGAERALKAYNQQLKTVGEVTKSVVGLAGNLIDAKALRNYGRTNAKAMRYAADQERIGQQTRATDSTVINNKVSAVATSTGAVVNNRVIMPTPTPIPVVKPGLPAGQTVINPMVHVPTTVDTVTGRPGQLPGQTLR